MEGVVKREDVSPAASSSAQSRETMESGQQHQQYNYGPPTTQPPPRASPNGQHAMMQQPSLLPPIHHGGLPSQPQYAAHPGQYVPPSQYSQYQNGAMQPAPMPSTVAPTAQNGMMRFSLPPAPVDARGMTASRHKKEIKRRTKTGCLTCRKRRIKCDEGQPTCKNCHKSKRECLGYDPIFKQQPAHAPLAAKPDASTAQPETTPTLASGQYHPPPGFAPAAGSFGEYHTSLDPALSGGNHPVQMAQSTYLQPERRVKPITIHDLFALNNVSPPYQSREAPVPPSEAMQQEIADFYTFHYAPGLDRIFETEWYSKHGLGYLRASPAVQDFVLQCTEHFKQRADDPHTNNQIRSLETRLIWQLAGLPRANTTANPDLCSRVDTLENLLTGQFIDPSRVPVSPQPGIEAQKYNQHMFWHSLGRFVSARDDQPDPNAMKQVTEALGAMRSNLGMLENRDVLYSIAIARHIGGRMPEYHPQRHLMAVSNDPDDDVNKVKVAHGFVEAEDQRGTTQVIQRICGMALRSWALQKQ